MGDDKTTAGTNGQISYDNEAFSNDEKNDLSTPVHTINNGNVDTPTSSTLDIIDGEGKEGDVPQEERELREQLQAKRDQEPLLICRLITHRPKTWFGFALGGHILFVLITAMLTFSGYDILPIVFDSLPLDIRDDVDYLRGLAWDGKDDTDQNIVKFGSEAEEVQDERSKVIDVIEFVYNMKDGSNIISKENLQKMQQVENQFFNDTKFQTSFCFTRDESNCTNIKSLINYFDGSKVSIDSRLYDPQFDNIISILHLANTLNETKENFQYHLGKGAVITSTEARMSSTRSSLLIGFPLSGYSNTSDRFSDQEAEVKKFLDEEFRVKGEDQYKSGLGSMEFIMSSQYLISLFITSQVFKDFALVVGSFGFIFIFMVIQTGSFWVTGFAIGTILTGFAGANLIYRVILDFRYFGIFHVLAIFIILGIGADDVFVFFDTWKETAHHSYKSLAHRFSDCYRKASMAMLFTSLTTAVAFFVSATSPFLAVYSFGTFAGILVIVNYISVIIFFPSAVIVYHLYWEKYKCCCCCPRNSAVQDTDTTQPTTKKKDKKNPIVRFFATYYFRFVTHKIGRWFCLAFYGIVLIIMIVMCTKVEVNEAQVEFLKESTMIGRYLKVRSSSFESGRDGDLTKVLLVWGLKDQDMDGCHHTNATCTGITVWDDKFNMNSATAQNELMGLCNDMMAMDDAELSELNIKPNIITQKPEIKCFIKDMSDFYTGKGVGFPLTENKVQTLMNGRPVIYHTSLPASVMSTRYFEVGVSNFLFNGFTPGFSSYMEDFQHLLGEAKTPESVETSLARFSYWYGTEMRYAAIVINTTIDGRTLGYPSGLPIRDKWEEWMTQTVSGLSEPLQGGFQCTPTSIQGFNLWHWLKVQKKLVSSAVIGIVVGITVALPILIFATHNIIVGFIATFIIAFITISVIGVIPAAGWKLGLLESLNLVLVVGLAVDYVVHLAEGYSRSLASDRITRTQHMLEEVGISVLSGALTTLGASMFLLPAKIIFFSQFGLFMFSTIGFSILYSLGLFTTLIAIIGPQGTMGSLKPLYAKCCKKKPENVSSNTK